MEFLINEHIKNLPSKKPQFSKESNAIRLDKGELPFPPSPKVIEAITKAATDINRYPEILGGSLREALVGYTGTDYEQIFLGNGSDELIELILKIFLKPSEKVLLPIPTFFVYEFSTQLLGNSPILVSRTDNFDLDVEAILKKITSDTKVLFIANPNNPTANLTSRDKICQILDRVSNCIVVVDECYYEISQETVVDLIDYYPNLVILRSFSKGFGLAGLRIGYGIANSTIADSIQRASQLFSVNEIALKAATAALKDTSYIKSNLKKLNEEKNNLASSLTTLGLTVYPSNTNFLFVNTKFLDIPSKEIVQFLQEMNIFIADFGSKQGLDAYYLKITVGTHEENQILIEGLSKAIDKL